MQIATKVITGLGAILTVVALGWLLTGAFDYFSGRKIRTHNRWIKV